MRKPRKLPAPPADRDVLSVVEAAGLLGVGETTIREAVKDGKIPHTRFGRRILFRRTDLDRMMDPTNTR
jgi:excisionase family DNA binding protein